MRRGGEDSSPHPSVGDALSGGEPRLASLGGAALFFFSSEIEGGVEWSLGGSAELWGGATA